MALNTSECNHLTPLHFKGLKRPVPLTTLSITPSLTTVTQFKTQRHGALVRKTCYLLRRSVVYKTAEWCTARARSDHDHRNISWLWKLHCTTFHPDWHNRLSTCAKKLTSTLWPTTELAGKTTQFYSLIVLIPKQSQLVVFRFTSQIQQPRPSSPQAPRRVADNDSTRLKRHLQADWATDNWLTSRRRDVPKW